MYNFISEIGDILNDILKCWLMSKWKSLKNDKANTKPSKIVSNDAAFFILGVGRGGGGGNSFIVQLHN